MFRLMWTNKSGASFPTVLEAVDSKTKAPEGLMSVETRPCSLVHRLPLCGRATSTQAAFARAFILFRGLCSQALTSQVIAVWIKTLR